MKQAFLNDIRRGLGRAYLELQNSCSKEDYLDTLLYACLNDSSYMLLCEGPKSDYLYKMIKLYNINIQKEIRNKIVDSLNVMDYRGLMFQKLELLLEFYWDGDDCILDTISSFYNLYINKIQKWTKHRLLSFEILAIIIDKAFGIKKTKEIVKYIFEKGLNKEYFGWYFYRIVEKYKKNKFIQNYVKSFKDKYESKKEKSYTLENLLNTRDKIYQSCFSNRVSDEEFGRILEYLDKSDNIKDIKKILGAFDDSFSKRNIPTDICLNILEKYGNLLEKEVYESIKYNRSYKVLELGISLIKDSKYLVQGLIMLFTNYSKEYKEMIIEAYKKVNFSFNNEISSTFTHETIDFMKHKKKNYPDDILFINYAKSYDSFLREYIFNLMKLRGVLTKEIIEESLYDFNYELNAKAKKYYKNNLF